MEEPVHIALVGHPNVGKSVVFSKLTGISAISSNYAGTTVEFQEGKVRHQGRSLIFYDLPGTYGLTGATEDELVATKLLAEKHPECVVVIADATRLEPSLVLAFQVIELGYPTIILLNQMDVARKRSTIDVPRLQELLGVPVVPSVAITGEGMDDLVELIVGGGARVSPFQVRYDSHIQESIDRLRGRAVKTGTTVGMEGSLIELLEGNEHFTVQFAPEVFSLAQEERRVFYEQHQEDIQVHINRDRYGEAGRIITEVVGKIPRRMSRQEKISELTLKPWPGIPILVLVLTGVFLAVILIGSFLETELVDLYTALTSGFFDWMGNSLIGGQVGQAIAEGLNLTLLSIVAIVIPYIVLFYLILAVLEDSGYLPRVVILLDGFMQKLGLSGRSVIPMIVGSGCNVPAILATRVLGSRRERLILATVIILAVPCGAQTVVILRTVGTYGGIGMVLAIYLILLALIILSAWLLHRFMKEEPIGLMFEVPDLTLPRWDNVLSKTYHRTKDFFVVAFPILLVTSLVLEFLMVYGWLDAIVEPLAPLTEGFLGLPAVTIIALLFGILRKEMSLQLLVVLFGTADLIAVMTLDQMFVFALVMATFVPCVSAFSVLIKEFGVKDMLKVTLGSIVVAFSLGGLANLVLQAI